MKAKKLAKSLFTALGLIALSIGLAILDELIYSVTGYRVVLLITVFVATFLISLKYPIPD